MKKVDFLLGCEVKGRELESLCLLRHELIKRGYSVEIKSFLELSGKLITHYDAEVFASGGLRFWSNIPYEIGQAVKFRKHIEMPWEEVFQNSFYNNHVVRDQIGLETVTTVWGEKPKRYFIENESVNSDRIFVCGHPVMDFCKPKLKNYYRNRESVAEVYNISTKKQWNLFSSSFTTVASEESWWIDYDKANNIDVYHRLYLLEKETQNKILEWFRTVLSKHKEQVIIYRPHPDEIVVDEVYAVEKEFDNFYIIRDMGIIQWLRVCDRAYTWISTSTAEAFFVGMPNYILRPVKVPQDIEIVTFSHPEKFIEDVEGFEETFYKKPTEHSISDKELRDFYYYDEKNYTYSILADLFEEVYKNEKYKISEDTIRRCDDYMKKYYRGLPFDSKIVRWI